MHKILSHPLLYVELTILRDKGTNHEDFRRALDKIAIHLCLASTSALPLQDKAIETPIQATIGSTLADDVILVPILRAGLTLLHSFTQLIPNARIGYLGLKRDEQSLEPHQYYCNIPPINDQTTVIVLDPMLATGGSMCAALKILKERGAQRLHAACVIAAPEGIKAVESQYADVSLVCAGLDDKLNDIGYIVPGLGDAGDRAHGTD